MNRYFIGISFTVSHSYEEINKKLDIAQYTSEIEEEYKKLQDKSLRKNRCKRILDSSDEEEEISSKRTKSSTSEIPTKIREAADMLNPILLEEKNPNPAEDDFNSEMCISPVESTDASLLNAKNAGNWYRSHRKVISTKRNLHKLALHQFDIFLHVQVLSKLTS